jgi:hypothetical protein
LTLFGAGVVGLLRGEWISVAYDINHKINTLEAEISHVLKGMQQGVDVPLTVTDGGEEHVLHGQEAITRLEEVLTEVRRQHEAAHTRILRRYGWMKWFFLIGIGSLLIARAFPPAHGMGSSLLQLFR